MLHTCDGRQRPGVGASERHAVLVGLGQVGVAAELLLLGQLEGDRDHTKLSALCAASSEPPALIFSDPHPFAVQRVGPLPLLGDEDHAAPLLLLLALAHLDLGVAHRHHHLLRGADAHAAGARQGPGGGRVRGQLPVRVAGFTIYFFIHLLSVFYCLG